MKKFRLLILFIIAVLCGLFTFSYIASLEDGSNELWMIVTAVLLGGIDYLLARRWDEKGLLPDEVSDRKNDRA